MNPIRPMLAALVLAPALALAQGAAQPSAKAQGAAPGPAATTPAGDERGKDAADEPRAATRPEGAKGAARPSGGKGAAATGAAPPSAAQDLARALTTPESWNGILDGYASSLAGQIAGALAATGKEAPPDLEEKVRDDLDDAVRYEQAIEMQARALSGRFSEDELRTLERFYRDGPGKKLLDTLPEIARQVNDELRSRLSERVPRIVQRYAPSVAAEGSAGSGSGDGAPEREQPKAPPGAKPPGR